jgi:hypothetical protein
LKRSRTQRISSPPFRYPLFKFPTPHNPLHSRLTKTSFSIQISPQFPFPPSQSLDDIVIHNSLITFFLSFSFSNPSSPTHQAKIFLIENSVPFEGGISDFSSDFVPFGSHIFLILGLGGGTLCFFTFDGSAMGGGSGILSGCATAAVLVDRLGGLFARCRMH